MLFRNHIRYIALLMVASGASASAESFQWVGTSSKVTLLIERGGEHSIEVLAPRDAVIEEFHLESYGDDRYLARIAFKSQQLPSLATDLSARFVCWTGPQPYSRLAPDLKSIKDLLLKDPMPVMLSLNASSLQRLRALYNSPNFPFVGSCKLGLHQTLDQYLEELRGRAKGAKPNQLGPCRGAIGVDPRAACLW